MMNMVWKFLINGACTLALLGGVGALHAADFAAGQVWSYKTRSGEEASTLLINKVEPNARLGPIYHISVFGVHIKNAQAPSGFTSDLPHFPVGRKTLQDSCIKRVGSRKANPDYLEGYAQWHGEFTQGKAGVFTIPVSEIISVVETALQGDQKTAVTE
jgi:hypothetical protein